MPFPFEFTSKKGYVNLTVRPAVAASFRRLFFISSAFKRKGFPAGMSNRSIIRQIAAVLVLVGFLAFFEHGRAAKKFNVAIDIGHSPGETGTLSARNRAEYDFNRKMALEVFRKLKKNPRFRVFIINPEGKKISLEIRTQMINAAAPDLLISIHHDSVQPIYLSQWTWKGAPALFCDKYRGYSIFTSDKNVKWDQSRSFAITLGNEMRKSGFMPSAHHSEPISGEGKKFIDESAGVYRFDELAVLKNAKCPAVLLECGIIRNRSEETLLRNRAYRQRIAGAIASAVSAFLDTRAGGRPGRSFF
jgi:N-acetylmuramoyl-L-alanine amidase